ncbi:KGG domain-containing protein [Oscillibacter sp.]|uniref:KGG domain-containing protein n=1 Tax=Oscillibacter sp. TaxID=1945593 RepID=UPI00289B907B|nr:KGG domain-containing protein [Oscillibacter sp.]
MGSENLIPMDQRSEDEVRELGAKGGKASGAARRRKRSLKDAADLYLSLPVSDRRRWNKIARRGIDPEDVDNQMAMIIGLTEAATQGDAKAAKIIVDLLGDTANNSGDAIEDDPVTKSLKETIDAVTETDQNS